MLYLFACLAQQGLLLGYLEVVVGGLEIYETGKKFLTDLLVEVVEVYQFLRVGDVPFQHIATHVYLSQRYSELIDNICIINYPYNYPI